MGSRQDAKANHINEIFQSINALAQRGVSLIRLDIPDELPKRKAGGWEGVWDSHGNVQHLIIIDGPTLP